MLHKEVIDQYDSLSKKNFNEYEVYKAINRHIKDNNVIPEGETLYELMAFEFYESFKSMNERWSTYYGPMVSYTSDDGNSSFESPPLNAITKDAIAYWTTRSVESVNPILKARYSGLVYDFSKLVSGIKPNVSVSITYSQANIDIAKGEYYNEPVYVFEKLRRALGVALSIRHTGLVEDCKRTLLKYERENSKDEFAGLWGHCFEHLVNTKKKIATVDEEKQIISDMEYRFLRLLKLDSEKTKAYPATEEAATILAAYYKKNGLKDLTAQVITVLCTSIEIAIHGKSATQVVAQYNRIYKLYKRFQLNGQAKLILLKLRQVSPDAHGEMRVIRTDFTIPSDDLRKYIEALVNGDVQQVIINICEYMTIDKEEASARLTTIAKKAPINYLFTKQLVDNKGRTVATIGPIVSDFEGNLIQQLSRDLSLQALFLRKVIEEAIIKMNLNKEDLMVNIKSSPVFDNHKLPIIEKGLEAYFLKDYIISIHLLIPQIENAIRNIVEFSGGNVLRQVQDTDAFMLRTFDDLLSEKAVSDLLGENVVTQFKVLFTDQRGWNLRNNVCHGISDEQTFSAQSADYVVHALSTLALIQSQ